MYIPFDSGLASLPLHVGMSTKMEKLNNVTTKSDKLQLLSSLDITSLFQSIEVEMFQEIVNELPIAKNKKDDLVQEFIIKNNKTHLKQLCINRIISIVQCTNENKSEELLNKLLLPLPLKQDFVWEINNKRDCQMLHFEIVLEPKIEYSLPNEY